MDDAFVYAEPSATTVVLLASFFILLNVVEWVLDRLVYCGLIGQVLVGMAWGTPGTQWLSDTTEATVTQLGYLGLILLIFEGGLSSKFAQLRANFALSLAVAVTGISLPLALSFVLIDMAGATPLQAFAAGTALCSTSLGTALTVLRTSNLAATRLGAVLASAALIDDVVGLVMVQLVQELDVSKTSEASGSVALAIIRPISVSFGLVLVLFLACRYVITPASMALLPRLEKEPPRWYVSFGKERVALLAQSAVLGAFVAAASYAGGSALFAAYLVGAATSWWYDEFCSQIRTHHAIGRHGHSNEGGALTQTPSMASVPVATDDASRHARPPGEPVSRTDTVYERYYAKVVSQLLKPCFFASIGFALPIRDLFRGAILWRGLVYAALMALAKLATGLWLLSMCPVDLASTLRKLRCAVESSLCLSPSRTREWNRSTDLQQLDRALTRQDVSEHRQLDHPSTPRQPALRNTVNNIVSSSSPRRAVSPQLPASPYPAILLGCAMVPRGEIGFLIAALAQSAGVFGGGQSSDLFLIANWAIFACTIAGPVATGLLARRVQRIKTAVRAGSNAQEPLGLWGEVR